MASTESLARGEARRSALIAVLGHSRQRAASLQELAQELGWSSRLVHYHLGILAERGAVQRLGGARGYMLAPDAEHASAMPRSADRATIDGSEQDE